MCRHCLTNKTETNNIYIKYPNSFRFLFIQLCLDCYNALKKHNNNLYCTYCGEISNDILMNFIFPDHISIHKKICNNCVLDLKTLYGIQQYALDFETYDIDY